jgi:hypothetical protein
MSRVKKTIVIICGVLLLILIGCASMQDAITPCVVEPKIIGYVQASDPCFSPKSLVPYTSLADSRRTQAYFNFYHVMNQTTWQRIMADDSVFYDFQTTRQNAHEKDSMELEQQLFSPSGMFGLLATTLLSGTVFGTLGGVLIKRPQDKSPAEVKDSLYTEDEHKADIAKYEIKIAELTQKLLNGGMEKPA